MERKFNVLTLFKGSGEIVERKFNALTLFKGSGEKVKVVERKFKGKRKFNVLR